MLINVEQTSAESRGFFVLLEAKMEDAVKINQTLTLKVTPHDCLIFLMRKSHPVSLCNPLKNVCLTFSPPALCLDRFKSQVSVIVPPPPFICAPSTILPRVHQRLSHYIAYLSSHCHPAPTHSPVVSLWNLNWLVTKQTQQTCLLGACVGPLWAENWA